MGKITDALNKLAQERQRRKDQSEELKQSIIEKKTASAAQLTPREVIETSDDAETASQDASRWKDRITRRTRSLEQRLREYLKNRIYIAKAVAGSKVDPRVVTFHDPSAPFTEQYRILRTNLIKKSQLGKQVKVIAVTSALPEEGKSVTAANLAAILSQHPNTKVLLIDADLRKGILQHLFGIHQRIVGLSEVLEEEVPLEEALFTTPVDNLSILPKGIFSVHPTELLSSNKMRSILEKVKNHFDFVIIDTPPALPFADAGVVGSIADGTIVVVQGQKTNPKSVRLIKASLEQAKANILGFILTRLDVQASGSNYYYNYTSKN